MGRSPRAALYYAVPLALYVGLTLVGVCVLRDRDSGRDPVAQRRAATFLNEFYPSPQALCPLNKWDGVWYAAIALDGYALNDSQLSRIRPAFFPLYPLAVGGVMRVASIDFELASAVFSVAVLTLLFWVLRRERSVALALLLMPTGFVLVAPYSEGLFLLLAILQRQSFEAGHSWRCFGYGFLTGLTRPHALTLSLAYAVEWMHRWVTRRDASGFRAAVVAAVSPTLGALSYFGAITWFRGTPSAFFDAKRDMGGGFSSPMHTLWNQARRTAVYFSRPELSPKIACVVEWVLPVLVMIAVVYLFRRRQVFAAAMAAGVLAMILTSGSLWGLPRFISCQYFTVVMIRIARDHRWSPLALAAGAAALVVIQAFYLWAYFLQTPPSV